MDEETKLYTELLTRLGRVDSLPGFSVLNETYTQEHVNLSITPANLLAVLLKARSAREHAVSYRKFDVGAAAFTMRYEPSGSQIFTGANFKPSPESPYNIHAEQLAVERAHLLGYQAVSMIGVVGETQPDQQSGHEMNTLHPCGKCRSALGNSPLVSRDRTLIATASPDLRTIELSTVTKLNLYHDDAEFHHLAQIALPDLSLLHPFEQKSGVIQLADSQKERDEEDAWEESVSPHLLRFRLPEAA